MTSPLTGMPHTRIYLVRHAETEWNAEARCQGRADAPFSALGEQQLASLAASLTDVEFTAAYTSPLRRAQKTAEAILAGTGLRAATVPELAELDYGERQGSLFEEWPAELFAKWRSEPWSVSFLGGESLHDVKARAVAALRRIVAAHPGETVLVSSHGHVNRVLLLELETSPRAFWDVDQPNGTVTILELSGESR